MTDHPINRWSGTLPLFLSLTALFMVSHGYADYHRFGPPADEGGAEHLFLIALAIQLPMMIWFVYATRREARRARPVFVGQLGLFAVALLGGLTCPGFH
jgi:hypothetical protein